MKYRKKAVVIDAVQLKADNFDEVCDFMGVTPIPKHNPNFGVDKHGNTNDPYLGVYIETLEGRMLANYGDYIIKGVNGEFYPCKPDIFEKTYTLEGSDSFLDRLYREESELAERLEKCSQFIDSEKFREVIKEDYPALLLHLQLDFMRSYHSALLLRIEIAKKKNKDKRDTHDFGDSHIFGDSYSFGGAIQALKFGLAIRRSGWNDKGLFVIKQIPAHITEEFIPKMQSLPQSAKDIIMSRENKVIDYTSQMLIINTDGRADSWVPSASDVFAEDWEIITE